VINWLAPILGNSASRSNYLCDADALRRVLERERVRSDRNGFSLSLVMIAVPAGRGRAQVIRSIEQVLERRLRKTDVAGLLNDRNIGIVLPETAAKGARKVVADLKELFAEKLPPIDFSVHEYPTYEEEAEVETEEVESGEPSKPLESFFVQPLPLWKRGMDILGAAVGLVLLSPLLTATAIAVKLSSPGPIFFRQMRHGIGGCEFAMVKFRSMRADADSVQAELRHLNELDGPVFKITDDPRITPVGKVIRALSIDELPQLWHVLTGKMTLVGPRPLRCEESNRCEQWQRRRLDVTPGLTCLWQVRQERDLGFDSWCRMDLQYIGKRSPLRDVSLILQTVTTVLFRKNA